MSHVTSPKLSVIAKNAASSGFPTVRAGNVGNEKFIEFVHEQAKKPSGAQLVVTTLEGHVAQGERLDDVFKQILKIAKATVAKHEALTQLFN